MIFLTWAILLFTAASDAGAQVTSQRPHTTWVSPWDGKTRYQCRTVSGRMLMADDLAECPTASQLAAAESKRKAEVATQPKAEAALEAAARARLMEQPAEPPVVIKPRTPPVKHDLNAAIKDSLRPAVPPLPKTPVPSSVIDGIVSGLRALFILGLMIYFVPSIIAYYRRKVNAGAILALNIFLGWTFIGWVVAFVWSVAHDNVPSQPPAASEVPGVSVADS